jgi:predicted nucleic acid-binding Zn ribbon protein
VIRAAQVIPSVLAEVIRKAPLTPEKVDFAWRHSVGPALERMTKVRLDDHGVLHVTAADPHWAREVRRASPLILERIETMLGAGAVAKIKA